MWIQHKVEMVTKFKKAGSILNKIFIDLESIIREGVTTKQIEETLISLLDKHKVSSGTLGLNGFPNFISISVNEEILGGIPSERILREGDLVKLDLTIKYKDIYVDKALTIGIPPLSHEQFYTISAAKRCITNVIKFGTDKFVVDNKLNNYYIGYIIENTIRQLKIKAVRDYGGHGIGKFQHMVPFIPNFSYKSSFIEEHDLKEGDVFTIEPLPCYRDERTEKINEVVIGDPISAHYEDTIIITETGLEKVT